MLRVVPEIQEALKKCLEMLPLAARYMLSRTCSFSSMLCYVKELTTNLLKTVTEESAPSSRATPMLSTHVLSKTAHSVTVERH